MSKKRSGEETSCGTSSFTNQLQYCIFCYRIADSDNDVCGMTKDLENLSQPLMHKFFLFCQRYLHSTPNETSDWIGKGRFEKGLELLGVCQDCSFLLRDFCALYDQIKVLELKLNWRLKELREIMKCADKVPARVKVFQNEVMLAGAGENDIGKGSLIQIKKIRNDLIEKCSAKLRSTHPKVVLKRCHTFQSQTSVKSKRCKIETVKSTRNAESVDRGNQSGISNNDRASTCTTFSMKFENPEAVSTLSPETKAPLDDNFREEVNSLEFSAVSLVKEYSDDDDRVGDTKVLTKPEIEEGAPNTMDRLDYNGGDVEEVPCSPLPGEIQNDDGINNDAPCSPVASNSKPPETSQQPSSVEVTVQMSKIEEKRNEIQVKREQEATSNLTKINEIPRKVVSRMSSKTRKKSARKLYTVKKKGQQQRQSKRLLKKAKSHHDSERNAKAKTRRFAGAQTNNSKGEREFLSLKQLALNRMRSGKRCHFPRCIRKGPFFFTRDLANHLKLHGKFKCNFCRANFNYAPYLLAHEAEKHSEKGKDGKNSCPRCKCNFSIRLRLPHFLESHLKLVPDRPTCPVCRIPFRRRYSLRDSFLQHFNNQHDLTGIASSTIKKCEENNCGAYFRTYVQLNEHMVKIHGADLEKKYRCRDCGKQLKNLIDLQRHQLNHTTGTEFKVSCTFPDCKKMFETEADLQIHERRFYTVERIACPQCNRSIRRRDLETHLNEHNKFVDAQITAYQCKTAKCEKEFYNVSDLENHSRLHGEFSCQFCNAVITFAPELPIHEFKCHNKGKDELSLETGTYSCTRCYTEVEHQTKFIYHFLKEHLRLEADRHTCAICGTQFGHTKRVPYILKHFKLFHDLRRVGPDGKIFKCEIDGCSAYFLTQYQLNLHTPSHAVVGGKIRKGLDSNKMYECRDCHKQFKSYGILQSHRKQKCKHQGSFKKIKCTITSMCPFRFETQAELDDHIEKNAVKCPKCDKSVHGDMGLKRHLEFHERKETGKLKPRIVPKKWQCETCGKYFKTRQNFNIHLLSHTGPETWEYMCNICSKKCLTKQKLDEHVGTHTNEEPKYVCEICGVKYKQRQNLRIHVNSKHGDIVTIKARTYDKSNLTSSKGVKKRRDTGAGNSNRSKVTRKRRRVDCYSDTTFSDSD